MPLEVHLTARKKIIALLVEDKMDNFVKNRDLARHALTNGFPGFDNMSVSQLRCMVRDAGLNSCEGMRLLLQELAQKEPIVGRTVVPLPSPIFYLPIDSTDPLKALAQEIRYFFENDASSPFWVQLMLDTLGTQAEAVRAEDDFKGFDQLTASQLRRLVPVTPARRDRVRDLLAQLEGGCQPC